jgi:hypothetical protein
VVAHLILVRPMNIPYFVTLIVGPLFTLVFAALICFHRRRHYATWAKITSIVSCVAGLGWFALGIMIADWKSYHLTRDAYFTLVISILVARPYRKLSVNPAVA